MTLLPSKLPASRARAALQSGSVFVVVLWIALGLVTITIYFANSMSLELRAADNRASGAAAEQAIEGAARYVAQVLTQYATNGAIPDPRYYSASAVPVGDAQFWLIGRDTNASPQLGQVYFGLVDEGSKVNLNRGNSNEIAWLPRMTLDLTGAILDWRTTNGDRGTRLQYSMMQPPYQCKGAAFETVDELHLVFGALPEILDGEDLNHNGVLDANEQDLNGDGIATPGVLDSVTVYSREPNFHSDGTMRTNVTDTAGMRSLLEARFSSSRANEIMGRLGIGGGGPGGGRGGGATQPIRGLLQLYVRSGMTADEFALVYNDIAVTTNLYTEGRININTASAAVLACLPGMDDSVAKQLVNYRQTNPSKLQTIAWIVDALGENSSALQSLQAGDFVTTQSYQFTADIAAVGPFGRGYRRVKYVFDVTEGTPKIVYRRDLGQLGWALGENVRQTLLAKETR